MSSRFSLVVRFVHPTADQREATMLPSGSLTSPVTGNLHQEPTLSLTSVPSARIFSSHGEKDRGSQWQAFNVGNPNAIGPC